MKMRATCLMITLAMLIVIFAGCGGDTVQDSTVTDESVDNTGTEAPQSQAPEEEPDSEENGESAEATVFPLAEKRELSYYFMWSQALCDIMDDPEELLYFQALEEATNVHLDIEPFLVTNAAELYPVMVAGGDWCDLVDGVNGYYAGGYSQALEDDFIIPLNDYVEYMPNYSDLIDSNEELKKVIYLDDGSMPSFGTVYNGGYPITYGLVIRTDWLEQVGMEMPRTIEDYHDVLTAFKTELGVESPLWMSMYGAYQNHAFSSAFGVTALTTTNLSAPFYVEDGQVYFGPIQDGMKQYLATMAQWYEEGLIYSDFMTVSNNFFPDFSLIQELGVYTIPVGIFNQMGMYSTDENFAISASYDPVLNEGDTLHITYSSDDVLVSGLCITSECSDPVLAAQYIDFWYSEEGFYILNYGVEGETYEFDESGDPVYITDVVFADDTLTTDQCLMLVSKQSGSFVIDYLNRQSVAFNDAQMEAFDIWGEAQDDYLYPTNALLNTEESELYAQMYPELATYIQQYIPAVIIGDIDLDSSWDEYIATCEELGSEECTAVKQAAYDRYLAR